MPHEYMVSYQVPNTEYLSKIAFISFHGRMLKGQNLKMGTSSKAQFTLTVRTASVYIAKANILMGILFTLLYWGFETSLMTEIDFFPSGGSSKR